MLEGLPTCVAVDPVIYLAIIWCPKIDEGLRRTKCAGLCAKVGSAEEDHVDSISQHLLEFLQILKCMVALPRKDVVNVVLPCGGGDVPLCDVPYTLGMFQERSWHQCDVPECHPAQGRNDGPVGSLQAVQLIPVMLQVLLRDQAEFFQVVLRVQVILVDLRLADDGVEEKSIGRHLTTCWHCHVAFRVDVNVPVWVLLRVEVFRNQDHLAPGCPKFLVVLVGKTEERVAWYHADSVDSHHLGQVLLHLPKHLVGFANFDRPIFQVVMFAQLLNAGGVNAGHRRAAEIHREPSAILMRHCFPEMVSAVYHAIWPAGYPLMGVPSALGHLQRIQIHGSKKCKN